MRNHIVNIICLFIQVIFPKPDELISDCFLWVCIKCSVNIQFYIYVSKNTIKIIYDSMLCLSKVIYQIQAQNPTQAQFLF